MTTWLEDSNGNRCSVERFGSAEAAQAALNPGRFYDSNEDALANMKRLAEE